MKFIPDMICCVDRNNVLKQDTTGVYIVRLVKIIRKRWFGKTLWLCENLEANSTPREVQVEEHLLKPGNMTVFRFNTDVPVVNGKDINNLDILIRHAKTTGGVALEPAVRHCEALKEKLKFYNEMRNV